MTKHVIAALAVAGLVHLGHRAYYKQQVPTLSPAALESCKDRCNHECSGEQVLDCLLACGRCEPHLCGQCDAHQELESLRPKVEESCASRCKNECPPAAWPSCLVGCRTGCHPSKCGNCNHLEQ